MQNYIYIHCRMTLNGHSVQSTVQLDYVATRSARHIVRVIAHALIVSSRHVTSHARVSDVFKLYAFLHGGRPFLL